MYTFLQVTHIIACLVLIGVVLLQAGEGEGLSGAFGGGGSYALFGKRGATGFIAKATSAAAVIFMLTSFSLTYTQTKQLESQGSFSGAATGAPLSDSGPATGAPLADN